MALSNCPLYNTLAASSAMPTVNHFSTCLIHPKGNREICFVVSSEAVGEDTPQSKYQHVPISSIQLNRVKIKCSSLSNTAAKLAYASTGNSYVRLYRAAVARITLTTYVKFSLSLHIELNQDGK